MATVMLGTLVGVTVLNAYLSVLKTKMRIHDQLRDVAGTLSNASFPLTDAVLRQTSSLSGAEFVVADRSNQVLSSSRNGIVPPTLSQSPQPGKQLVLGEVVRVGDKPYLHAVVGVSHQTHRNEPVLLHIFYPERSYRTALWNAVFSPLLVGGVALVLVVILAIIAAARVTRPLGKLRSQVERIAHGDFQPVSLPRRNDEIRDLGQSFNRMAKMLADYEAEVRRNERLRTLGQLSGSMAHQLRNAATGCRMALDLHSRECPVEHESEALDVARRQLTLMEGYLKHFFSREDGPAKPHVPVDLVSVVENVLTLVRPNAEHVGVRIEFVHAEQSIFVSGNGDDLEQLVINLVLNAIEAAAGPGDGECSIPGEGRVTVRLESAMGDRVCLEVQDSGPGPVAEVKESMFEPLITGRIDGTGLGLSVTREIAMQHSGEIRWERRDGMTCFITELPLSNRESIHVEVAGR